MKTPSLNEHSKVLGFKTSIKPLVNSLLGSFYLKPKDRIVRAIFKVYTKLYKLPIEGPFINANGLKNLVLIASYTDNDEGYLPGLIDSCDAFEKVILYHDKNKKHNFNYNESLRFQLLIQAAKRNGAEWVLVGSPKTRFSVEFRSQIEPYIKDFRNTRTVLALKERYLWGDFDHYAYVKSVGDGVIIQKLFAITDDMIFDNKPIHASQRPINYENVLVTPASRYYLGRFNLDIMKKKAEFYNKMDGQDYSFLCDVSKPVKHKERVRGIGEYEKRELTSKKVNPSSLHNRNKQ